METTIELNTLTNLVAQVFNIEDITPGDPRQKLDFIVRYRGSLRLEDSVEAYDQLANSLKPLNLMPLFRWDNDRQAVMIVGKLPPPKPSNPVVNLILFILTLLSVLLTGAIYSLENTVPATMGEWVYAVLVRGWPFAVSMLGILGVHEFGHYLMGRRHGVHVTLPYFIPFPFSPFGTMGAFISMKEPPKNRRDLLDIGMTGPLAGLVVALPVLVLGLYLSRVDLLPVAPGAEISVQMEGNSILYLLLKFLMFGRFLPSPVSYDGVPLIIYWIKFFFSGSPFPWGGTDVLLHPVAWAGWAGLLVTSLNLIPAGQLDGGHILYVLFGRKIAARILPAILVVLVALGFIWNGWWLWVALIYFFGRIYAEPLDQITTLDNKRKVLALLTLVIFILIFVPVPLSIY